MSNEHILFDEVRELCKANGMAIDRIARDTNNNQKDVAELFLQTMRTILDIMEKQK